MKYTLNQNKSIGIENDEFFFGAFVPFAEYDLGEEKHLLLTEIISVTEEGECRTSIGKGEKVSYLLRDGKCGIELTTDFITVPGSGFFFSQKIRNISDKTVHLRRTGIKTTSPFYPKAFEKDDTVITTMHGDYTAGNRICSIFEVEYEESLLVYANKGKNGFLSMGINEPEAFTKAKAKVNGGNINFELYSEMCCIEMDPGESRNAQDIAFLTGSFDKASSLLADNFREYLGYADKYPVPQGWCSWYSVNVKVNEQHVLDVADFFAENTDKFSPDFIQIDEGYQIRRGDWEYNSQFPNGVTEIVRRIRKSGARPGIWMCPIVVDRESTIYLEHPEYAFLREGQTAPVDKYYPEETCFPLDFTNPNVKEFVRKILKEKVDDGFTYFKLDFDDIYTCGYTSYDPKKTQLQAYRDLFKLYREVLSGDIYLLGCTSFTRGSIGLCDACRIGTDSSAHWNEMPLCLLNCLRMSPMKYFMNKKIYACDSDVTYLRIKWDSLTEDERKIWHSYIGISGGLVAFSELRERIDLYTDQLGYAFPHCPETAKVVYPVWDPDNERIGFNAERDYGNFGTYLLWSNDARKEHYNTDLSYVLDEIGKDFHVFSFWDRSYLGIKKGDFEIENFSARKPYLYRFTPVEKGKVQIIGTTLHFSMGAAEIKDFERKDGKYIITLTDSLYGNGELYLYSEKELKNFDFENIKASAEKTENNIYKVSIDGKASNGIITFTE